MIVANYHGMPHDGLNGRTPLEALQLAIEHNPAPVRTLPHLLRTRLHQLQPVHRCTVRGNVARGVAPYISFYGARYSNEVLQRTSQGSLASRSASIRIPVTCGGLDPEQEDTACARPDMLCLSTAPVVNCSRFNNETSCAPRTCTSSCWPIETLATQIFDADPNAYRDVVFGAVVSLSKDARKAAMSSISSCALNQARCASRCAR